RRNRARIGADRAPHGASHEAGQWVLLERRHRLALPVRGWAHVQDHTLAPNPRHDARLARADDAVRDPLDPEVERLRNVRGIAGLSRVAGEAQAGRPRGLERGLVRTRRVADLVPGEVAADHTTAGELAADAGELD